MEKYLEHFSGFKEGSSDYGAFLESIIKYNRCKTIIEIGVAFGTTTTYLCNGAENSDKWEEKKGIGFVHGFDIWSQHGMNNQFEKLGDKKFAEEYLEKNNKKNYKLYQIDTKSDEFKEIIKSIAPIDFAFIDGDHSYHGVSNDFNVIYPHLSTNGIIAFHDTFRCDGAREFILDLRNKYYDGTFDIISLPWGNRKHMNGLAVLFKRYNPKLKAPIEICGSNSTPEEIVNKEVLWLKEQAKK